MLQPPATESLEEVHHRLHPGKRDLSELIFGRKQGLLGLKHGQKISRALSVLKLCDRECFAGGFHLPLEMIFGLAIVRDLAERVLYIRIGIEDRALITCDQLPLCRLREVLLTNQLAA